jgi:hypothetical protein
LRLGGRVWHRNRCLGRLWHRIVALDVRDRAGFRSRSRRRRR